MVNYFLLFDIAPKYDLDLNLLHKKYLKIHKKLYSSNSIYVHKRFNVSQVNEGYKLLKDPYYRAEHFLQTKNINIQSLDLKNILNQKELEEFLLKFEEVDSCHDKDGLKLLLEDAIKMQTQLVDILSEKFTLRLFHEAVYFVIKLKYVMRLIENIKSKMNNVS